MPRRRKKKEGDKRQRAQKKVEVLANTRQEAGLLQKKKDKRGQTALQMILGALAMYMGVCACGYANVFGSSMSTVKANAHSLSGFIHEFQDIRMFHML